MQFKYKSKIKISDLYKMTTLPNLPILNIQLTTNIKNLGRPTQTSQSFRFNPSMLGSRAPSKNKEHKVYVPTDIELKSANQFGKDKLSIILSKMLFTNKISSMRRMPDTYNNLHNNIPIILKILFETDKLFKYKNKDYTIKKHTWDGNWVAIPGNNGYIDINVSLDLAADKPQKKLNIRSSCEERSTRIQSIFDNLTDINAVAIPVVPKLVGGKVRKKSRKRKQIMGKKKRKSRKTRRNKKTKRKY